MYKSVCIIYCHVLLLLCLLHDDGWRAYGQETEDILDTTTTRPVVVHLPDLGRVQGKRQSGIDFFGGLPYAAPPVGHLRWAPPEPPAPWAPAKLDATHFGPDCWQLVDPLLNPGAEVARMSEDCLYLNVFTPAGHASRHERLPVLVWLHGGAFQQGGARRSEYDGRRLAERGTIVVTINYRLGALGFLVSSVDGLFGNFGLMDQRAALHWVQENIAKFGGDPDSVTLFGESAGAVMTGLHLMMEGAGSLFHRAIIQSNPLGWQVRAIVVADFIGEAMKRSVDCRDVACLRAERVEEIMRAQSSLMGVPRSVGDFFTWGPTLTEELKLTVGGRTPFGSTSPLSREHVMFRDLDSWKWQNNRDTSWAAVNVTQPLKNLNLIPDDIPVIIGANKHEGEMFVHGAFPITMSKTVYWMFVGALFRDSASRVLKHYRAYVDQIEREAEELARCQIEEEENRQYYLEHKEQLDHEYQLLLEMNSTKEGVEAISDIETLVQTWSRGGAFFHRDQHDDTTNHTPWHRRVWPFARNNTEEAILERARLREERRKLRIKERALKAAARVVVDYRPVMSRIIDDYLFRCPAWHYAHSLSRNRIYRGKRNNVYVYQFSHSTHIPGYEECWGKSCHTSEIPYVFQAMDIIRSNYSTLGPHAQREAPSTPEYPYTDMLVAYREAMDAAYRQYDDEEDADVETPSNATNHGSTSSNLFQHSMRFQRLVNHFFGDYFKEDADEEIASDMADRWVSFAKTGDPNYEGSKAYWRPWRYILDERLGRDKERPWEPQDFDKIFDPEIEDDWDENDTTLIERYVWSDDPGERTYRRRALHALAMEVVDEDVFQTMLRRTPRGHEDDNPFNSFLFGSASKPKDGHQERLMSRQAMRQLQEIAQNMGVLGTGLQGEARRGHVGDTWDEDFFPEILELKWPPEGRLVERDCTCDMWDRIRYRY
ncbi:predicted protein [Phaeodactylum tricornutum CCAP 1055/1]|uniref:Carboxylesterase type B domain-containing protein n=1 Tax=Phaeodactylum tricornutum (strain CCAP 1055/1) TaxID=556484 RepID=B5Y5Q0_PHATC|nr:predicted protein [Phaeodactylum tricornutum CCAP 1055/1]ACI65697.1 predicted protein [Phaeodactylum tricornutum CCAP 1055/1]|eukprot:XP_002186227.1 predicted protein [Phaeodactylum tricornutum CCAP 1055/1]